jgi:hypothetical protein
MLKVQSAQGEGSKARPLLIGAVLGHHLEPVRRHADEARAVDIVHVCFRRLKNEPTILPPRGAHGGPDAVDDRFLKSLATGQRQRARNLEIEYDSAQVGFERTKFRFQEIDLRVFCDRLHDLVPAVPADLDW